MAKLARVSALRASHLLMLSALALSGCSTAPGSSDPGDTLGNLFAFNSLSAPPVPNQAVVTKVNCPVVDVFEGAAAQRVYAGGQSSSNVRYQFSMGDLARECSVENNKIVIKVGVEGKVLLGPAGAPSSFTVPLRVAVRTEADQKIIQSKSYRVQVSIPQGQSQTPFTLVADPIIVPFLGEDAFDDYQIFVGFEGAGAAAPVATKASKRKAG